MKYQNKLKLKYTLYSILGIFTNLIILLFARLFEREIEVLITMICFFLFRKLFEKQYHCKTLLKCSIVSIAIFSIVAIVEVDKSISILLSIILSFVITFVSYFVKDYIDKNVIVRKLNSTKVKCLENLSEEEMIKLMPNLREDIIHIIYGYLHKPKKTNAEIYAIQNNIGVATLYRYLKLVKDTYEKLTTY